MSFDGFGWRLIRATGILGAAVAATLTAGSAAGAAVVPPGAGPANGHVLGGMTAQRWPVVITISANGKRIQAAQAGLVLTCSSGDGFPVPDAWGDVPLQANGGVNVAAGILPSTGNSAGSVTGGSDTFTGRLNRKRATFSGTWQLKLNFLMSSGQIDQCDSGRVAFSARL